MCIRDSLCPVLRTETPEHMVSKIPALRLFSNTDLDTAEDVYKRQVLKEALLALKDQENCDFGKHVIPYCFENDRDVYKRQT